MLKSLEFRYEGVVYLHGDDECLTVSLRIENAVGFGNNYFKRTRLAIYSWWCVLQAFFTIKTEREADWTPTCPEHSRIFYVLGMWLADTSFR